MAKFNVGEEVELNIHNVHHGPGATVGLFNDPNQPPEWTNAVVERIEEHPVLEGYERYHVRVTGPVLAGATGPVRAETLRKKQVH